MKKILKKLKSRRGESLVEVLCAILIFTLSSVGMYTMVMTANDINTTAKEMDELHKTQMIVAEKAEGEGVQGTITMTVKIAPTNSVTTIVDVRIFGAGVDENGVNGALYSYFKAGTAGVGS